MDLVTLITGSGSGIGRAIALRFSEAGNPVVINDIHRINGEQVLSEILGRGGRGLFVPADISDIHEVRTLFEAALKEFGRVDVLVNNAGVPGAFSFIADMPDETWHKTIAVHLTGTFYCMREALRSMMKVKSGRIINIASIAGLNGTVGSGEYGAAKAGIINLTKTCAKEAGPFRITVNAIAPGMVGTPTNLKLQERESPFIVTAVQGTPTGRMTDPDEIARLCLFLASPGANNITGQVITLDGGAGISMCMDDFMRDYLTRKSRQGE